jgi:hypothetical protein
VKEIAAEYHRLDIGIKWTHKFHTNVGTSVLCHPILRGLGGGGGTPELPQVLMP